ncbi:MAG: NAD-dependent epimerase/dehydratase family protein, partial [Deltaproteobacteria bacterium]
VPNFISQALGGEPLTVYGDGSQTRSFCYVSDLVEGMVRLLRSDYTGPVNCGNPQEVTILEFARTIIRLSGSKSPIVFRPLPEDDPKVRQPDIARARKLLGWEPRVGLEEGLRRTIAFFGEKLRRDAYVAAGHDVIVVDDLSTGRQENLNPRARFHQLDIGAARTAELVRDEKPEVLNHHAAQMDVRRSVADPLFDARVNILGTIHLLEAARQAAVQRLLLVSSGGAVYGEQETYPAPETHATNPLSPYGVSKRSSELYAFFYQAEYRLPFVALRYANVYGPRQDPHGEAGVVAIFTGRMLGDEPVVVNGDGRQTRDYLYVGDVARANLLALETRATGPFNIGTGVETDVNALASLLLAAAGSRSQVRHGPPKSGEQRRSVIDCRRAAELLGWRPEVSLAEGLGRTVAWFRERAGAG